MGDIIEEPTISEPPAAPALEYPYSLRSQLLTGSASSALLWLALPVLAEQILLLLVGWTDMYLAGTVGKEATSAVGLSVTVGWLVGLMFSFVGAGATALVSRYAGAGDMGSANHFSNQTLSAAALMGFLGFLGVYLLAPIFPGLLGWDSTAAKVAVPYLRIESIGHVLLSVLVMGAACWRGIGDTRTPLYIMGIVNVVNILVSASLRYGWGPMPQLGVYGIATGTAVARTVGGLLVIGLLLRGRSGLKLHRRDLRLQRDSLSRLLRVGIPAGVDGLLLWSGQFMFLRIVSQLAEGPEQAAYVAAHFVGIRVEALSYLPAFAWATAAATMVGQSLGAGTPERARYTGNLAAVQGSIVCAVMGAFYFLMAPQIYYFFNNSGDAAHVAGIGVPALRVLGFFQVPLALMIIYTNALRGAGDTRFPLIFTCVGMCLVRLPLAYLFGIVLQGGLIGAWVGMYADMTARAAMSTARFLHGGWQKVRV